MEWINVNDELPEPEGEYIISVNGLYTGVAYYGSVGLIDQFYREDYDDFDHSYVTHWMPLPKSPGS